MTIQQCYEKFGGDYEEVLGRFSKEAFIRKFIIKFLSDKATAIYLQLYKMMILKLPLELHIH